jgi:signal transduction histidine kinase
MKTKCRYISGIDSVSGFTLFSGPNQGIARMTRLPKNTEFATPERASSEIIRSQNSLFENHQLMRRFIDQVFEMVAVLNPERQIIMVNRSLSAFLKEDENQLLGKRPGEAMHCAHANITAGGCGTSEFCKTCGAVKAILEAQKGESSVQECRISIEGTAEALDLRVFASPLEMSGNRFTVFTLMDISHEKRRRALERIFFHDVLNTAGGLQGFVELLTSSPAEEADEIGDTLTSLAEKLIEEIQGHRDLMAAENHDLAVNRQRISSRELVQEVCHLFRNHEVAAGRNLVISPDLDEVMFESDSVLVRRVIGNMVKNALEAAAPNETVTVSAKALESAVEFRVHNPQFIPRHIQLQIFQRSFSTKAPNRGLGTYSIKLLAERYLAGQVSFTTCEQNGTTFVARIPLAMK